MFPRARSWPSWAIAARNSPHKSRQFAKLAARRFPSGASHVALPQANCINADYSHRTELQDFGSESGRASGTYTPESISQERASILIFTRYCSNHGVVVAVSDNDFVQAQR